MTNILALDVGEKRIGVAAADTAVPVAVPLATITVDGSELEAIKKLIADRSVGTVVVGYPRNQSGEATDQTAYSESFARKLRDSVQIVFQDESLTSKIAEDRLRASGKPYDKEDIDAFAAVIILQDYLEIHDAA